LDDGGEFWHTPSDHPDATAEDWQQTAEYLGAEWTEIDGPEFGETIPVKGLLGQPIPVTVVDKRNPNWVNDPAFERRQTQ
jgi:hypothetical protein